jgi:hypothetical protein
MQGQQKQMEQHARAGEAACRDRRSRRSGFKGHWKQEEQNAGAEAELAACEGNRSSRKNMWEQQ